MSIHQELFVAASPARVFETLTTGDTFSRMTGGAPTSIDATAGGAFSLFGGAIEGRSVELVPAERIVQAWRPASWPAGQYSLVRFELRAEAGGTRVSLEHVGYPAEQHDHLAGGWQTNYLLPLAKACG